MNQVKRINEVNKWKMTLMENLLNYCSLTINLAINLFIYNLFTIFIFSLLVSSHVNRWRCDAIGYNISPVMYEMEKFAALEL